MSEWFQPWVDGLDDAEGAESFPVLTTRAVAAVNRCTARPPWCWWWRMVRCSGRCAARWGTSRMCGRAMRCGMVRAAGRRFGAVGDHLRRRRRGHAELICGRPPPGNPFVSRTVSYVLRTNLETVDGQAAGSLCDPLPDPAARADRYSSGVCTFWSRLSLAATAGLVVGLSWLIGRGIVHPITALDADEATGLALHSWLEATTGRAAALGLVVSPSTDWLRRDQIAWHPIPHRVQCRPRPRHPPRESAGHTPPPKAQPAPETLRPTDRNGQGSLESRTARKRGFAPTE